MAGRKGPDSGENVTNMGDADFAESYPLEEQQIRAAVAGKTIGSALSLGIDDDKNFAIRKSIPGHSDPDAPKKPYRPSRAEREEQEKRDFEKDFAARRAARNAKVVAERAARRVQQEEQA